MRKFWGIILIVLGWFIALMTALSAIPNILKILKEDWNLAYKSSFLLGTLLGLSLFGLLSYWLIKSGIQLTKKKKEKDQIDKIMSIK